MGTRPAGVEKAEGARQQLAGRWRRGKCWREGSTRGAGRRASTPGCLRSRLEGRVEFAGCFWGLVVDPREPLRIRERGQGAPHRPVPPRQAGSRPHVCEFAALSEEARSSVQKRGQSGLCKKQQRYLGSGGRVEGNVGGTGGVLRQTDSKLQYFGYLM